MFLAGLKRFVKTLLARLIGSDTLQIGKDDGEFSRKNTVSFRFDRVACGETFVARLNGSDILHTVPSTNSQTSWQATAQISG